MTALARWLAALALAALAALAALDVWVARTVLPPLAPALSTTLLDRDGRLLRAWPVEDGLWRLPVDPAAVDPGFVALLLAFEDRRFHRHAGVDPLALARAAWQAARHGRIVSGGSTLTMQVARLLEDGPTGRATGKLRQMRLALALERRLDKPAILGLYLHLAPYGGNIEGLRAASLSWFGKEPARLTPAEAALLVALPQAPNARRPDRNPAAAAAARDRVLVRAVLAGALTPDAATAARLEALPGQRRAFPALAPHLGDRLAASAPQGAVLHTTLDARLQAALEAILARQAAQLGPQVSGAAIVADHRTGDILARAGSAGYTDTARRGYIDMTLAPRSPGSALKPFIYALAFDQGLAHPDSLIEDRPTDFADYAPQNFDRIWRGTITVRRALQDSANIPAVALLDRVGPAHLMAALRRGGASPLVPDGSAAGPPGLAIALGGVGMTLDDMTGLYAALAHGGTRPGLPGARPLFGRAAAWQVADILSGIAPPAGGTPGAVAWKTGTSWGHRDAWALGFDGAHVAGIWFGRPDGTPVPGTLGVDAAAPALFDTFAAIGPRRTALPAPPPETLTATTAELPPPLRHVGPGAAGGQPPGPEIAFPPDGARLPAGAGDLVPVRLRHGTPPFRWLADGLPVAADPWAREAMLPVAGRGFATLSVIDATGAAARVGLFLD
jgi:penicillin-binding protein 1C